MNNNCYKCGRAEVKFRSAKIRLEQEISRRGLDNCKDGILALPPQDRELLRRFHIAKEQVHRYYRLCFFCRNSGYECRDKVAPWISAYQKFLETGANYICNCCNWPLYHKYKSTIWDGRPEQTPCFSCPYAWQGFPLKASVIRTMDKEFFMDKGIVPGMLPPGVENIFGNVPGEKSII